MTFSTMGAVNAELEYKSSFGNLSDGTVYLDAMKGVDRRDEIKSALATDSNLFATGTYYSGTSGSIPVLLPSIVDKDLYDVTRKDTPLANGLIPRVANMGLYADIIKRTALPSAVFKPEGSALTKTASTYTRAVAKIKYMYTPGEITGPMQVASEQQWKSALKLEVEAAYRALKELEENTIINGNPTSGTVTGSYDDENAFTGLIQAITTNTTDKDGGTITVSDLRTAIRTIRLAYGRPNLIVTDFKTFDDIKALLQDSLRYNDTTKIAWGITAIEFEGIPIIADVFMPSTASSKECLVLDTSSWQIRVMKEATFEEGAKTADSYAFWIKQYATLLSIYEAWNYEIYGLA